MPEKISENFDVLSVELEGKNLIEAAAGTGKTYSIAIMVLRWILNTDHTIDSVLAVTFTNYATAELKERILNFLEEALAFFESGKCKDETIEKICRESHDPKKALKKLKAAVNDFDTASIFTIHGFCQKLIKENAFELGIDLKMELSEDTDLSNEASTGFFRENIMNCHPLDDSGGNMLENKIFRGMLSRKSLKEFISKAGIGVENRNIKISIKELKTPLADKITDIYKNFAESAPLIVKENREKKNVMGFDDILLIIYEVLKNTESSAAESLREIMKERYSLVLIDEFQDTDPLQYFIFKSLFCNGHHTVFFIGDPKQSIYAFRKADIFSYIEAAKEKGIKKYVMKKNFRSSYAAVEATNEVFSSADIFGDDSLIKYEPVSAAKSDKDYSLTINGKALPGILVRETEIVRNKSELQKKITSHISQAICEMIKKDSPFKIREKTENGISERTVKASDIAVLTAKNDFALEICEKLKNDRIPAIVEADTAKQLSIFSSEEAVSMQKLLSAAATEGLAEFKTLLLTSFYNKTVDDIADENTSFSELHEKFESCFKEWSQKGFYAAFSKFTEDTNILANIAEKGEKTVTILRQLSELIHKHELSEGFSPLYTQRWFSEKIKDSERNDKSIPEEESVRTENEKTDCVRIMTLHKSKGLEFNIVFFPFILNSASGYRWVLQHRQNSGGYEREMIFMPAKEAEKNQPGELPNDDKLEEIRRIYVGITRAKYLTVCYTQPKKDDLEPTFLFGRNEESEFINKDRMKIEERETSELITEEKNAAETELIRPATATREIKPDWALTSFSGIIAYGQNEEESLENKNEDPEPAENTGNLIGSGSDDETVPITDFPSGTEAGTVLHSIFEEADFSSADNTEIIRSILKKKMNFNENQLETTVPLVNECLNNVLSAPIFDGGATLRDVQNSKTAEMEFFLSIKDDVLEGKLSRIIEDNYKTAKLEYDSVKKGFLHGYIDLAAKTGEKYYIIDWKSNNLGNHFSDYSKENIEAEMKKHNYYLQYMLYLAAFDSYMKSADKDYSYENFGGIRYIFLRGVQAGSCETGIFSDRPEESELRKIQRLFEGRQ